MRPGLTIPALLAFLAGTHLLPAQETPELPDFDRRTPTVLAVENVGPAVVNIKTQALTRPRRHLFEGLFMRPEPSTPRLRDRSVGSGVVVHPDGYVLTNEHVVHGAARILVTLQGGRRVAAAAVNVNSDNDLAVLKLKEPGPYPCAVLGDSDDLMVGETTIALGNPFGLQNSVTTGILSATNRSVPFRGRKVYEDFLQTSALINPGNSGGPLLDINGRVIGINVAIDTRGQGIGYAIPINRAKEVMTRLVDPGVVKEAWLGFDVDEQTTESVVVTQVYKEGPARSAGIRPGDVIEAVGDRSVDTPFEFHVAVLRFDRGDPVPLVLSRDGDRLKTQVPFAPMPLLAGTRERLEAYGMACTDLTPSLARRFGLDESGEGVVVLSVEPGSPADRVGVKAGDVVLELGRIRVRSVELLAKVVNTLDHRGASGARITVYRDGWTYGGTMAF